MTEESVSYWTYVTYIFILRTKYTRTALYGHTTILLLHTDLLACWWPLSLKAAADAADTIGVFFRF